MRLLDRLYQYLEHQNISAYAFEHACDLSNGYLGKQKRGKGTMGSEVLLKIQACFPELNIHWLLTGKGRMLRHAFPYSPEEDPELEIVQLLQERIVLLEKSLKMWRILKEIKLKNLKLLLFRVERKNRRSWPFFSSF